MGVQKVEVGVHLPSARPHGVEVQAGGGGAAGVELETRLEVEY